MTLRVNTTQRNLVGGGGTLRMGSRGPQVAQLQQLLTQAGCSPGAADGAFGPRTDAAVRTFQRTHGLTVDGVVGPKTWAALTQASHPPAPAPAPSGSPTLQEGASGAAVTRMQQLLSTAGDSPGSIDGQFGPRTLNALKRFQAAHGLGADGICGPRTWAALQSSFKPAPPPSHGVHPTLNEGAHGAAVTELQNLLNKAGIGVGVDGSFGPQTRSGVERFQYSRGLSVDGVVGPQTWSALLSGKGPVTRPPPSSGSDLRQRMLDIARSQLGMHEATNNNDGEILKYPRAFGRGSESWCADFVSWVSTQAGKPLDYAYCPYLENHLKATGQWKGRSNPMAGDIVLFDWNSDGVADHVGLVESVNKDGSVNTIEGNTTNDSNGEEGVWRKTRYPGQIIGFGNPA